MELTLLFFTLAAVIGLGVVTERAYDELREIKNLLEHGVEGAEQELSGIAEHLSELDRELKPLKREGGNDWLFLSEEEMEKYSGLNTLGGQLINTLRQLRGELVAIRSALERPPGENREK